MNANELAEYVENTDCEYIDYKKVATMLRQQQAEIEELKKKVITDDYVFICKRCGDELSTKFKEYYK